MSEKKGLSAFIKKQQKGGKGGKGKTPAAQEEATGEETKAHDAEVAHQSQTQIADSTKKDESSDEEVDEFAQGLNIGGSIRDKKDVTKQQQQDAQIDRGYGFDDKAEKQGPSAGADGAKDPKQKKTAADIKFGGAKPKFARGIKGGGLRDGFSEGLDDIDDDGNVKKRNRDQIKGGESGAAAEGTREFINLGASARVGGAPRGGNVEEDKQAERKPVKPTFRGKANLTKTGGNQDDDNVGVVTSYGFSVALRGPQTDKDKNAEGNEGQARKAGGKFGRDKGQPFSTAAKQTDGMDDDGFELVQDKDRKRRAQKQRAQHNSDSDSDDGFKLTKGGPRGGRGGGRGGRGGGYFKNSRRDAAGTEKTE